MKRTLQFILLMILIVVVMPLIIVKGCSIKHESYTPDGNQKDAIKINVFVPGENLIREMLLEDYVKGVVAAEMPAEFESEALKAQAVAARTYAYSRMKKMYVSRDNIHSEADICTNPAHCQAWVDKSSAMSKWKLLNRLKYWSKIEKAVNDTRGVIVLYNNTIINPVFHSNSGGRTENAEDVWEVGKVPYLVSVPSSGEEATGEYKVTVPVTTEDFIEKIKSQHTDLKLSGKDIMNEIKVVDYTAGGRIKTIKVGNIALKGTEVRTLFSLRSANFKIEKGTGSMLNITTIGNGHGVGLSQWGANYLAKSGGTYEEILKHYYTGVELSTIDKLPN